MEMKGSPLVVHDARHALVGFQRNLHIDLNIWAVYSEQTLHRDWLWKVWIPAPPPQIESVKGRGLLSLLLCITLPPSPDGGDSQWQ